MARPKKESPPRDQSTLAVQAARLYYYQDLTSEAVAKELGLSRPAVSRLLTFARQSGLVEIRVHDPEEPAPAAWSARSATASRSNR